MSTRYFTRSKKIPTKGVTADVSTTMPPREVATKKRRTTAAKPKETHQVLSEKIYDDGNDNCQGHSEKERKMKQQRRCRGICQMYAFDDLDHTFDASSDGDAGNEICLPIEGGSSEISALTVFSFDSSESMNFISGKVKGEGEERMPKASICVDVPTVPMMRLSRRLTFKVTDPTLSPLASSTIRATKLSFSTPDAPIGNSQCQILGLDEDICRARRRQAAALASENRIKGQHQLTAHKN